MMGRTLSRSLTRKLVVTLIAIVGFVLLYEVSMFDLRGAGAGIIDPTLPAAGARLEFTATAYCKGTTTASGVVVRTGIAASDPSILPVGSVVNLATDNSKYNGVYTIMDTGPKVQGRMLDLYMWSCHEALAFGRKRVQLGVLRLGWNPSASTASFIDRLFRRRESARVAVPVQEVLATAESDDATEGTTADSTDVSGPEAVSSVPSSSDVSAAANAPVVPVAPSAPTVAPTAHISNTP
jgi:3D (Asp-Asp-Asp) domain-containing protein